MAASSDGHKTDKELIEMEDRARLAKFGSSQNHDPAADQTNGPQQSPLEQLLNCVICLDRFRTPKVLPCQHTYCLSPCMEGLVDYLRRQVKCPECRAEHHVPTRGVACFPDNLTIKKFLEIPMSTLAAPPPDSAEGQAWARYERIGPCDVCDENKELTMCGHCNRKICESCKTMHVEQLRRECVRLVNHVKRSMPRMNDTYDLLVQGEQRLAQTMENTKQEVADTFKKYIKQLQDKQELFLTQIENFRSVESREITIRKDAVLQEKAQMESHLAAYESQLKDQDECKMSDLELISVKQEFSDFLEQVKYLCVDFIDTHNRIKFVADTTEIRAVISKFGDLQFRSAASSYIESQNSEPWMMGSGPVYSHLAIEGPQMGSQNIGYRNRYNASSAGMGTAGNENFMSRYSSLLNDSISTSLANSASPTSTSNRYSSRNAVLSHQDSDDNSSNLGLVSSRRSRFESDNTTTGSGGSPSSTSRTSNTGEDGNVRRFRSRFLRNSTLTGSDDTSAPPPVSSSSRPSSLYSETPAAITGPAPATSENSSMTGDSGLNSTASSRRYTWRERDPDFNSSVAANNTDASSATTNRYTSDDTTSSGLTKTSRFLRNRHRAPSPEIERSSLRSNRDSSSILDNDSPSARRIRRYTRSHTAGNIFSTSIDDDNDDESASSYLSRRRSFRHRTPDRDTSATENAGTGSTATSRSRYGDDTSSNMGRSSYSSSRDTGTGSSGYSSARDGGTGSSSYSSSNYTPGSYSSGSGGGSGSTSYTPNTYGTGSSYSSGSSGRYGDDSTSSVRARPIVEDTDSDEQTSSSSSSSAEVPPPNTTAALAAFYGKKGKMVKCIGMKGAQPGQFTWPRGVAINPSNGSILVGDSSNHRIQVFDKTGQYKYSFGSYGTGPGEFDCPAGVTVNSHGHVIVADRYNHRIQIFDEKGKFVKQFGKEGSRDGEFKYPWGVAADRTAGNIIYVADKENHRVQVFGVDGSFVGKFGGSGSGNGQFQHPHYLTVTEDGKVYVTDSNNHRVQVFLRDGTYLSAMGSQGMGEGQFNFPRGIAIDTKGYTIVGDSGNNRIVIFSPNGRFLKTFGSWGNSDGQLKGLEGVALTAGGKVVVCDRENHRVQIF